MWMFCRGSWFEVNVENKKIFPSWTSNFYSVSLINRCMISTSTIRNIVVPLSWSIQLQTFSGTKFVYHAKSMSPIRNIVVLLAWSASQYSLILPKLSLDLSSTGMSRLSFSVFLLFKPSSVLPQEGRRLEPVNSRKALLIQSRW